VTVVDLRTENATEPLGLDVEHPRFSWRLEANHDDVAQSGYQIQVATSRHALSRGRPDVWDSGKVTSSQAAQVEYGGPSLDGATRYHWRVRIWDDSGRKTTWSQPSWWETGLLFAETAWGSSSWSTHPFDQELPSFGDVTLELDVTVLNAAIGVFFRADDSGNAYMWQLADTGAGPMLRPHVRINGGYTLLDEVSLAEVIEVGLDQPHALSITAVGDQITTSLDGVEVDVRTDSTHASGTIGFRTAGQERGRVDDVTVTGTGSTLFSEDFSAGNPFSAGTVLDGELEVSGGSNALLVPAHPPAPRHRHEFTLGSRIKQARLYLSGLGY
jgi:alpha-L-rhamnosidase